MTTKQIAQELGLKTFTVSQKIMKGEIKGEKNQWGYWEVTEEDFDEYLLTRPLIVPNWYLRLKPYPTPPKKLNVNIIAYPHEVCIKNALPTLTPNEYLQASKLSKQRNMS